TRSGQSTPKGSQVHAMQERGSVQRPASHRPGPQKPAQAMPSRAASPVATQAPSRQVPPCAQPSARQGVPSTAGAVPQPSTGSQIGTSQGSAGSGHAVNPARRVHPVSGRQTSSEQGSPSSQARGAVSTQRP